MKANEKASRLERRDASGRRKSLVKGGGRKGSEGVIVITLMATDSTVGAGKGGSDPDSEFDVLEKAK